MQFGDRVAAIARQARQATLSRSAQLMLLGLLPVAIVIFVPALSGWGDAVPAQAVLGGDRHEAAVQLADLSKDMAALALATLAGVAFLLRETRTTMPSRRFRAAALTALTLALISIFASIRFRFAIAEQTMHAELMLDEIVNRLLIQAMSLLFAVSLLLALAGATLLRIDDRVEERTEA
jgi:hypothetical protein